ncbi:MAG: CPBP family intramembrane metalloprotease [Roseburia sp.]|nr:CPBP family intramembrane metalloprotease [Roseburia sp.]
MKKLYEKNELMFSLSWIIAYVVLFSAADSFSASLGVEKLVTAPVSVCLALFLFVWIGKQGLSEQYGLCSFKGNGREYLYFIPLLLIMSANLWNGVTMNVSAAEVFSTLLQLCYATAIGFLFTIIFFKGKSLLPCIIAHCTVNSLSIFAVDGSRMFETGTAAAICLVSVGYALWILRKSSGSVPDIF